VLGFGLGFGFGFGFGFGLGVGLQSFELKVKSIRVSFEYIGCV
jgi:hypothetical protein